MFSWGFRFRVGGYGSRAQFRGNPKGPRTQIIGFSGPGAETLLFGSVDPQASGFRLSSPNGKFPKLRYPNIDPKLLQPFFWGPPKMVSPILGNSKP